VFNKTLCKSTKNIVTDIAIERYTAGDIAVFGDAARNKPA